MTGTSTFLITGTSRGMGTDFARAALDAGHRSWRPDAIPSGSAPSSATTSTCSPSSST
ncbi:hypothetical protein [Curtobacterium flaccumfaciens]|uniref:hypothetical protein n=1 Tax=Curtobacterium flaccumfaciens TaxID=2035 RepID=UPI001E4B4EAE|nr:hypothetical protein [Curtobacterium allii]MCE0457191.1 hypothetical protein [Curtobacterium allii]